ncbi:MAG: GNAT family protein [Chloroflexota bacterium]
MARLLLRPYELGDIDAAHDIFGRVEVARYIDWEPMDRDAAEALVRRRIGQTRIAREGEGIGLAVVVRETGRMVGEIVLWLVSAGSRQAEVGWVIHPDVQGRGYATAAAMAVLRLGFKDLQLHRISAECDPRNGASIRLMERLGMRREAHLREFRWHKGEWIDSLVYAILEDEWRVATANGPGSHAHP